MEFLKFNRVCYVQNLCLFVVYLFFFLFFFQYFENEPFEKDVSKNNVRFKKKKNLKIVRFQNDMTNKNWVWKKK